jgi:hypothetical protein
MINTVEKKYKEDNNNFVCYKMTTLDNKEYFVPLDEANTDYQAIQKWIAEGGVVIDNPPTQENI